MSENKYLYFTSETWLKLGVTFLLLTLGSLIHWLNPALYPKIGQLLISGNIDEIVQVLRSYGAWAVLLSMLISILINILGFLPSIFVSAANGIVFGLVTGIIISWLAESIGVIISFYLVRNFFRASAKKLIAKSQYLKKLDDFSGANGFKMMLIARSIPYFPSGIITALGAVSSIRFKDYVLATLLGKFPSVALEVVVGHDIVNYEENMARLATLICLALLIYFGIWWWQKQKS